MVGFLLTRARLAGLGGPAKLLAATAAVLVAGCALSNEGAVDYRKASLPKEATLQDMRNLPLIFKNFSAAKDARVREMDSVSVHLKTAFIKDFFELPINPLRRFEANGEIAIVANVFELSSENDFDFANDEVGRLVFYSSDVAKGQFLNMNNLPIYGPIQYNGAPLAMRLTIFELDESSAQSKAMLGAVAKAGEVARVMSNPIMGLLMGLGRTLLSGSQNDIEFRFTMAQEPGPGHPGIAHAVLEAGNYVFVRSEDRGAEIPWDDLEYDDNLGRLIWKKNRQFYRDNTYMVVEVNKNTSSKQLDLSQNTFSAFLRKIREQDEQAAANLKPTIDALIEVGVKRSQVTNFNSAKDLLQQVESPNSLAIEKSAAVTSLVGLVRASLDAQTGTMLPTDIGRNQFAKLSDRQVDYVLGRMRMSAAGDVQNILRLLDRKGINADSNTLNEILKLFVPLSAAAAPASGVGSIILQAPIQPVTAEPLTKLSPDMAAIWEQVLKQGADYPLYRIAEGAEQAKLLSIQFSGPRLSADIEFLKKHELITCPGEVPTCTLTDKGRQITSAVPEPRKR